MQKTRKLNFWKLIWTRYTKNYRSFYEMFNGMALEPEERKSVQKSIIRTFVQTTIIFCIIGAPLWIWYYIIQPGNSAALNIIMIGTPIAIGILSIIGFFSRKMLKDFADYSKRMDNLTKGMSNSEGIMYDLFDFD